MFSPHKTENVHECLNFIAGQWQLPELKLEIY